MRKVYGTTGRNPIGPVIGAYTDEAALGAAGILNEESLRIRRTPAPCSVESRRGYAAWLAQLLADFFPGARNVPMTDWEYACGWKRATGWHPSVAADVLAETERLGVFTIDRHMQPWLVDLRCSPEEAWKAIFCDML